MVSKTKLEEYGEVVVNSNGFGLALVKREGETVQYHWVRDPDVEYTPPQYKTTYLEVCVPVALYQDLDKMIDDHINIWLKENGFTKEC